MRILLFILALAAPVFAQTAPFAFMKTAAGGGGFSGETYYSDPGAVGSTEDGTSANPGADEF